MAIVCCDASQHKGFQCVKKLTSSGNAYDKQRKCRDFIARRGPWIRRLSNEC